MYHTWMLPTWEYDLLRISKTKNYMQDRETPGCVYQQKTICKINKKLGAYLNPRMRRVRESVKTPKDAHSLHLDPQTSRYSYLLRCSGVWTVSFWGPVIRKVSLGGPGCLGDLMYCLWSRDISKTIYCIQILKEILSSEVETHASCYT